MLKLIFWGIIGYIVYRYFQIREQIREARRQDAIHHQHHREPAPKKQEEDGEFIDYEELK
jgi:hypothetical protein